MRRWVTCSLVLMCACATGITSNTGDGDDDGFEPGGSDAVGGRGGSGGLGGSSDGGAGGSAVGGGGSGTGGMGTPRIWINEIHYDNDGADTGEGVEIAGTAGVDLSQYLLEFYNQGASYATRMLSGTVPDQQGGFGTVWFAEPGIQNGDADAIALIRVQGPEVIAFLGYEGSSTATDGAAAGATAIDIGVQEATPPMFPTPVGWSLQLSGTGSEYSDFTWALPAAATTGQPNTGQTFQ